MQDFKMQDFDWRMMDRRSFIAVAGAVGLSMLGLSSCSSGQTASEKPADPKTRTITDMGGNEITLPEKIERVAITSITPLPSVYALFRGGAIDLVGMSPASMAAMKESYLAKAYPDILNVDTGFYAGNDLNVEELVARKPDVVFYRTNKQGEKEQLEAAGLCAIGFSVTDGGFNCIKTLNGWLELLKQVFPDINHLEGVIEQGNEDIEAITAKLKDLKEEDKPKVMMMHQSGNGVLRVSGTKFFGDWYINTCGGINVASSLTGTPEVSMEQIYEWNPDMIFINNFCNILPEDLIENKMPNLNWQPVKAVQEKKVYKFPIGTYRWFPPSGDSPLSVWWVAKHIHPEIFKDVDMEKMIKDYFRKYYQFTISDEDIQKFYNPSREASGKKTQK